MATVPAAAAPVIDADNIDPAVPSPLALTFADVLVLLKAGLNPRFCGDLAGAQTFVQGPASGDAMAFMGGFSRVVALACPAHSSLPLQKDFDFSREKVDNIVDVYVDGYVNGRIARTPASWATLHSVMNGQLSRKYAALAFTPAQKNDIAARVQAELFAFFNKLSLAPGGHVYNVYVHAFDMASTDHDIYSQFGKSGTKQLEQADMEQVVVQSTGKQNPVDDAVPNRLIWAFLQQARARADALTAQGFVP